MIVPEHFDAVIVGSGFGGSVMTYRLAAAGFKVCLLERGKVYVITGAFYRFIVALEKLTPRRLRSAALVAAGRRRRKPSSQ